MINRYKLKPITVSAVQYNGNNIEEIESFLNNNTFKIENTLMVPTQIGIRQVPIGNYLTLDELNNCHTYSPEVFKSIYEKIEC